MPAKVRVDDEGTVIYIDVKDLGESLDTELSDFTTRTVNLIRPDGSTVVITTVTVEEDASYEVSKLVIRTGTEAGLALSAKGDFDVNADNTGIWIGEVILADSSGSWTSEPFQVFHCVPILG
jgi:hypothetical protein